MATNKLFVLSTLVVTILVSSIILGAVPAIPRASAQQKVPGANWEYVNYDSRATNYNPQTQITKETIQLLELKWTYPIPPSTIVGKDFDVGAGIFGAPLAEGSITPPIVVDGILYFVTNYFRVTALDAGSGKIVWTYQVKANLTEAAKTLPLGGGNGHLHAIYYFNGWIIVPGVLCDVIALDALTGKVAWTIDNICLNVPGNAGLYTSGYQSYPPILYKKGNIVIYAPGVVDGFSGRGFINGYDLNAVVAAKKYTAAPKWRFFTAPPASGDPAWGKFLVDNCKKIWIQSVSACDIDQNILRNDWGNMGLIDYKGKMVTQSGTGTVWGQMSIDEDDGIVYMGLSQPTIDWNASLRPGPNLFSNSMIALNANTGELVWAHQALTHDLWDWDCSWNSLLGNIGTRKVIFKSCKNGITYAFDAKNGEQIWAFISPDLRRSEYTPFHVNSKIGGGGLGPRENSVVGGWDPRNSKIYTIPWQNYPDTGPYWQSGSAGSTDVVFDGKTIYTRIVNSWGYAKSTPAQLGSGLGRQTLPNPEPRPTNSTLYALDAATGSIKWKAFFDGPKRTGTILSGGIIYFSHSDGNLYALDADTGKIVWSKFFGITLNIPPTMGATADGKMRLFQLIGGAGTGTPGAILVWGLPDKIPEPQVITKEVIKEVPRDVVKEVIKEVPKEVVKEVPKEVIKEIPRDVIKEVPKEVVRTVTVEAISPLTYVGIGLGIIIAVVGIVAGRRGRRAQ